jgi:hypothetical protein
MKRRKRQKTKVPPKKKRSTKEVLPKKTQAWAMLRDWAGGSTPW